MQSVSIGPSSDQTVSPFNLASSGVEWLRVPGWQRQNWLWHGFSTRRSGLSQVYLADPENAGDGELNLGFTAADSPENVRENRLRFIDAVSGNRETPLTAVRQVHSNRTVVVGEDWVAGSVTAPEADGMMARRPGVLLGIQTADCIPVLVADQEKRAVAAFHAGWRGTVARIVELGVAQMAKEFGSDPAGMIAAIGPGIGACCYAVGDELRAQFGANFSYAEELFLQSGEDLRLDLTEANRRQLLAAGLAADSIATVGGCTACHPDIFYSHRASGGHAGRMMAVIGIR